MKDVNIGCKHIISIKNFSQLVIIIISSKTVWRKITSYNRSYIVLIGEREENLPLNHVHFHQAKPADQLFKKTKHINKLYVFLHLYVIIKSSSKIYITFFVKLYKSSWQESHAIRGSWDQGFQQKWTINSLPFYNI